MSEQLQEIITNSSIRSFNQGYNMGRSEERTRIILLLEESAEGEYKKIFLTPSLIKELKGETK